MITMHELIDNPIFLFSVFVGMWLGVLVPEWWDRYRMRRFNRRLREQSEKDRKAIDAYRGKLDDFSYRLIDSFPEHDQADEKEHK